MKIQESIHMQMKNTCNVFDDRLIKKLTSFPCEGIFTKEIQEKYFNIYQRQS